MGRTSDTNSDARENISMKELSRIEQSMFDSYQIQQNPRISVVFNHENIQYSGSDPLRIHYVVEGVESCSVATIERSVVWYTEGKGEEDFGVVFFERIQINKRNDGTKILPKSINTAQLTGALAIDLPHSPLSYEGIIVKIRWCVRIRIFFRSGRDFVSEHIFFLGNVPLAQLSEKIG